MNNTKLMIKIFTNNNKTIFRLSKENNKSNMTPSINILIICNKINITSKVI